MKKAVTLPLLLALCACTGQVSDTNTVESLIIKGSDTEVQLVSNLAEAFIAAHPGSDISVTGGGSATGIASIINGEADIANSSRQMSDEEKALAEQNGITVSEFILANDGLSVIVHENNPVKQLTMEQIGAIFSGKITNWKDVGGPDAAIVLYGRQSTSGTYGFFRDTVVKDDYAPTMRNMEGSQAIVDAVEADTGGVGYVGVGYVKGEDGLVRPNLGIVLVALASGDTHISPLDKDAVERGDYPIARRIYQYIAEKPAKGSLLDRFLQFEVSEEGQVIVEQSGFYPLNADDRTQNALFFGTLE